LNLKFFGKTYGQALKGNAALSFACAGLVVVAVLQQVKINSQHERTTLVPPQLTEKALIAWDSASASYFQSWGLFVVTSISAATPSTADYITKTMESFFDADLFQAIRTQLLSIKSDPNYTGTNAVNSFTPRSSYFEPETGKTFINGLLVTTAYQDMRITTLARVEASYEMKIRIESGVPKISMFTSYLGPARTMAWSKANPSLVAAQNKVSANIVPQMDRSTMSPDAVQQAAPAVSVQPNQGQQPAPASGAAANPAVAPAPQAVQPTAVRGSDRL
jgi:conjugal transfer pilus assembly protein TraE